MNPKEIAFDSVFTNTDDNLTVLQFIMQHNENRFDPVIAKFICDRFCSAMSEAYVNCVYGSNPYEILSVKIANVSYANREASPFKKNDYVMCRHGEVGFVSETYQNTIYVQPLNGCPRFMMDIRNVRWVNMPGAFYDLINIVKENDK